MYNDTTGAATGAGDATLLLDLDGLAVEAVEQTAGGVRLVRLRTADETAAACPSCGVFSTRVKEYVTTRPRDLPQGRLRLLLVWRKRRWYCQERLCPRGSFTESVPEVPAGARITGRLRAYAGDLVVDGVFTTVAAAGRAAGVSWPTVMDAVRVQAETVLDDEPGEVEALGIDEVCRGRPRWRPGEPAGTTKPGPTPDATRPEERESVIPQLEPAKARVLADRWHVGFTDISGGQGMLAQVEGRTSDDVAYWLAMQRPAWQERVRYVAIDMCTVFVFVFVFVIRRYLPNATIVVDHFHVVKLATDTVAEVRRRVTTTLRGRRGRRGRSRVGHPQSVAPQPGRPDLEGVHEAVEHPGRSRRTRDHDPEDVDRQGPAAPAAGTGRHSPRPIADLPPADEVLHLVRRRRDR